MGNAVCCAEFTGKNNNAGKNDIQKQLNTAEVKDITVHKHDEALYNGIGKNDNNAVDGKGAETEATHDEDSQSGDDDDEMDDEEFERRHQMMTGKKQRDNVVSEQTDVDPNWVAPNYPKSSKQLAMLRKAALKMFIFSNLTTENLNKVLAAFKENVIKKGTTVIKEGAEVKLTDPGLYILEKGLMSVYKKKDGKKVKVHEYKEEGNSFGDLALLYNAPRKATVVATKDCVAWSIARDVFNNLVKGSAQGDSEELEKFLSGVELLSGCTPTEINKLADAMFLKSFGIGEKIIKEGEPGAEFFIMKSGKAIATKSDVNSTLAEYGPTQYFGELALINDAPRKASITTVSEVEVIVLPAKSFHRLLDTQKLFDKKKYDKPQPGVQEEQIDDDEESDFSALSDSEDEMMDDDEFERKRLLAQNKGVRGSISGERFEVKKDYVPPVYPKTQEQINRLKTVMSKSFMFACLRTENLMKVIMAMQEKYIPRNYIVITQGSHVTADEPGLYVIEEGNLDVYKANDQQLKTVPKHGSQPESTDRKGILCCGPPETPINFDSYGTKVFTYTLPGQNFGELALLYSAPRAASVVSITSCKLWYITRDIFNNLVKNAMALEKEAYEAFLTRVPLLQALNEVEINKIVDSLKVKNCEEGDLIIKRGDKGEELFIIEEGEAEVLINGSCVKRYEVADYFGERALVKNEPRAADVVAVKKCRLLTIEKRTFDRVLGPVEQLLAQRINEYNQSK